MRRMAYLFLVLALGLAGLTACNESGSGQRKIGVVDLNRLMRDSAPGKEGLKFIEARQTKLQSGLDAIQARLEKNPEDQAALQELQKVYAASQQQMQADGQNVVGALFDAIQSALNSYRERNGYAVLIRAEALDSFDPALDVTSAVMAEVDKLKIDFKAAPAPEAPAVKDEPGEDKAPAEAKTAEPAAGGAPKR